MLLRQIAHNLHTTKYQKQDDKILLISAGYCCNALPLCIPVGWSLPVARSTIKSTPTADPKHLQRARRPHLAKGPILDSLLRPQRANATFYGRQGGARMALS